MIQSRYLAAATCFGGIAIGYVAGNHNAEKSATGSAEVAAHQRPTRSSSRDRHPRNGSDSDPLSSILGNRSTGELSSAELREIIQKLTAEDPLWDSVSRARNAYQLQLLLRKLSFSQLEQAAESIADGSPRFGVSMSAILNALTLKSPEGAMEWARKQQNQSSLVSGIIHHLATRDTALAEQYFRESLATGIFNGVSQWKASFALASAMARQGGQAYLNFFDSLPSGAQNSILSNTLADIPAGEQIEVLDQVSQRFSNSLRKFEMDSILSGLFRKNPAVVETWVDGLEPGDKRNRFSLTIARGFAEQKDTKSAERWMSETIAGSPGHEMDILQSFSNNDAELIPIFASL